MYYYCVSYLSEKRNKCKQVTIISLGSVSTDLKLSPADTWRLYNVVLTSTQRHDVWTTNVALMCGVMAFIPRRINVDTASWHLDNKRRINVDATSKSVNVDTSSWRLDNKRCINVQRHGVYTASHLRRYASWHSYRVTLTSMQRHDVIKRRINVDAVSWRSHRINVDATSSTLMRLCIYDMCLLAGYLALD